jgi:hypothetical protein
LPTCGVSARTMSCATDGFSAMMSDLVIDGLRCALPAPRPGAGSVVHTIRGLARARMCALTRAPP